MRMEDGRTRRRVDNGETKWKLEGKSFEYRVSMFGL